MFGKDSGFQIEEEEEDKERMREIREEIFLFLLYFGKLFFSL